MSDTYTNNTAMAMPAVNQTGWNVEINANAQLLDALNPVGDLCVTLTEQPSATLNVKVAAGQYINQAGAVISFAGASSQAITLSSTKVLFLDLTNAGALTVANSYPTTPLVRLATVTAGVSTITNIVDNRQCFNVVGSYADGVNFAFGTATGTQIGTSNLQKIGFFGKTPIVQPTVGAGTAGATYGANEQGMLQAIFNAMRNLGLGS